MISFCISTLNNAEETINSIKQNVSNYEIIIDNSTDKLTVKKNRMIQNAKNDIVVIMHDYLIIKNNWYNELLKIQNWDVAMCNILNKDNTRYRDWCIWDDPNFGIPWYQHEPWCPKGRLNWGMPKIAPYNYNKTQYMYISGAFWVAKRNFMIENPLDESLDWGQAEDVEWSIRVRNKWNYKFFNGYVQLIKQKDRILPL